MYIDMSKAFDLIDFTILQDKFTLPLPGCHIMLT